MLIAADLLASSTNNLVTATVALAVATGLLVLITFFTGFFTLRASAAAEKWQRPERERDSLDRQISALRALANELKWNESYLAETPQEGEVWLTASVSTWDRARDHIGALGQALSDELQEFMMSILRYITLADFSNAFPNRGNEGAYQMAVDLFSMNIIKDLSRMADAVRHSVEALEHQLAGL